MNFKNIKRISYMLLAAGMTVGCSQWDSHTSIDGTETEQLSNTVWTVIQNNAGLSTFKACLEKTGYAALLNGNNNYTVLAPTNEALEGFKGDTLAIVRNHIALLSYTKENLKETLTMLNGKRLYLDAVELGDESVVCRNGVVYTASNIVYPKKNIYEMICDLASTNDLAAFIYAAGDSVMDPDKSIQLGVDRETGLAYYDTILMYKNPYLDSIPVHDEDSLYTMVLPDNESFQALKAKYAKYMVKGTHNGTKFVEVPEMTEAYVCSELVYDLICNGTTSSLSELVSVNGIKIDMSSATAEEQLASNGRLVIADGVNIRMKDNKIKEVIVEGEDFIGAADPDGVYVRLRDYASGGQDVMYDGSWSQSFTTKGNRVGEDGLPLDTTISRTFQYESATTPDKYSPGTAINAYLRYMPHLYSTDYEVYWVCNDDIESHYSNSGNAFDETYQASYAENPNVACPSVYRLIQKMYIAEDGLSMTWSNGIVEGNLTNTNARFLAGIDPETRENKPAAVLQGVNAGFLNCEQPLAWYRASGDYDIIGTCLASVTKRYTLPRQCAGYADVFVTNISSNATDAKATVNGMIFLDYIRFVPVFNEENEND